MRVFVLAGVVATVVVSFGPVIGQIALLAATATLLRWTWRSRLPQVLRVAAGIVLGAAVMAGAISWVRDGYPLWPPGLDARVVDVRRVASVTPVVTRGTPADRFEPLSLWQSLELDARSIAWQRERRLLRLWLDAGVDVAGAPSAEGSRLDQIHVATAPHWIPPTGALMKSGFVCEVECRRDGKPYVLVVLREFISAWPHRYGCDEIVLTETEGALRVVSHRRWYDQLLEREWFSSTFDMVFQSGAGLGLLALAVIGLLDGLRLVTRRGRR